MEFDMREELNHVIGLEFEWMEPIHNEDKVVP